GPEERGLGRWPRSRVHAGEDRRGRLAGELLEGESRVGQLLEPVRPGLDERTDERPVLVERRPARRRVLLEGELESRASLLLERELGEGAETEQAQGAIEVRRPQHASRLRSPRLHSSLPEQVTDCYLLGSRPRDSWN